jgi:hypothetical protein
MTAAAQSDTENPRPGRINPGEAGQLANAMRTAGVTRASARAVLALLLRHTRGPFAIERSTRWIANEIGSSYSTAKRAIDDLVTTGLVVVVIAGIGRTRSAYLVDVDQVRTLAGRSRRGQTDPSEGSKCPPRGVKMTPPSARARSFTSLGLETPPPPASKSEPGDARSPAAGRGDPRPWKADPDAKCPHGRSRAQGGCRPCHTTARDDAKAAKGRQAAKDARHRLEELAARRAAESAERASSVRPPPDWRHKR